MSDESSSQGDRKASWSGIFTPLQIDSGQALLRRLLSGRDEKFEGLAADRVRRDDLSFRSSPSTDITSWLSTPIFSLQRLPIRKCRLCSPRSPSGQDWHCRSTSLSPYTLSLLPARPAIIASDSSI